MKEPVFINGVEVYENPHPWRNQTLIVLQSHGSWDGGRDEALLRNWPWLLQSGCDVVVSCPEDDPSRVFKGPLLGKVIKDGPRDFYKLQERAMAALELVHGNLRSLYSSVMLLHYDCMFIKPLPARVPKGLETYVYNHTFKQFKARWKACLPWWFGWPTLETFLQVARKLPVDAEQGYMDHWIPAVCEEAEIRVIPTDLISYPCSDIEAADIPDKARPSIQAGRPFVHGVKTEKALRWVLKVAGLEAKV